MERSSQDHLRAEASRYARQLAIPGFGDQAQQRLSTGHVFIAGLGGLGGPVSVYLTCAGVGNLTAVDAGDVELSNLNRQILYDEADVGSSKASAAARRLAHLNPSVNVSVMRESITPENVRELINEAQVVVDALDTLKDKLMLNQACVEERVPLVHGAVRGMFGEVTTVIPGRSPCLACIFPKMPHRPGFGPVLGAVAGIVGCVQAAETIKLLSGLGELLVGNMLDIDVSAGEFSRRKLERNIDCSICGQTTTL